MRLLNHHSCWKAVVLTTEYYCTRCGATLNCQEGFDPSKGVWTCTECGEVLTGDDVYDGDLYKGVAWFCDGCGAFLNTQTGFTDCCGTWVCDECGYINDINEDEIVNQAQSAHSRTFGEALGTALGNALGEAVVTVIERKFEAKRQKQREAEIARKEARAVRKEKRIAWRKEHKKGIRIILLMVLFFLAACILTSQQSIPFGSLRYEWQESTYLEVVDELKQLGFSNVHTEEVSDLSISNIENEYQVAEIKLAFGMSFKNTKVYPSFFPITIVYHTIALCSPPLSAKDAKGTNYLDVARAFEDAGYINIHVEAAYDIVTGWFSTEGDVKSISIAGDSSFSSSDEFRPDAEVIIVYHALKKDKP